MMIYKLLLPAEWATLERDGATRGAPIDIEDGFVHLSTAAQVEETARRYFAGLEGVVLAAVAPDPLGEALRWEPSRGGDLFPHLYRELRMTDVAWTRELPLAGGRHAFPPLS